MKRRLRLLAAVLLVGLLLPAIGGGGPAEAQALPDGQCDTSTPHLTLITCSDEAAAAGMTVAQFVAKYGGLFVDSGGNLLVIGALLDAWTAGEQLPIYDYESCRDFGGTAGACADAFGDPSAGWLSDLVNDQLTYAEMGEDAVRLMCTFAPHMSVCALLPENQPGGDSNDFTAYPGGSLFSGPFSDSGASVADTSWTTPIGRTWVVSFDPVGTLPSDNTGIKSTNGLTLAHWTDGTSYIRVDHRITASGMEFRGCAWSSGSNSSCSGWTAGQGVSSWTEGEGFVVGFRLKTRTQNPCSSRCDTVWQVVTPGGTIEWGGNWIPVHKAGVWPDVGTAYGAGAFVQIYSDMTHTALVEKIGIFDPSAPQPLVEDDAPPEAPPVRPEVDPLPEAPPAIPVPIPPPAEVPVPGTQPEVSPHTPVTEGTGDQGLFDQLANRIGGIIDGLIGAMGDFFSWLAQKFADLIGWLVGRLWEMFEWLFENLRALFEWLGDLLEWLGGILSDIYDELARITGVLGQQFQRLINKLGDLFEALGRGLANAFETLGDIVGKVWEAVLSIPEAFLDGLELLFIPSGGLDLADDCAEAFPCSWVQEGALAAGDLSGMVTAGTSSCVAPKVGFDFPEAPGGRFEMTGPVPSGCAGTVPAGGEPIGDLWGYRVPIRAALTLFLMASVVAMMVKQLPWAKGDATPLDGLGSVESNA